MIVVEIEGVSGAGKILRFQEVPDTFYIQEYNLYDQNDWLIFNSTNRLISDPGNIEEGGLYNPDTLEYTPPSNSPEARIIKREENYNKVKQFMTSNVVKNISSKNDMDTYINSQITDLASAKAVISNLAFTLITFIRYSKSKDSEVQETE